MIIRMAKVEILGPKPLLLDTLERLRETQAFQVDGVSAPAGDRLVPALRQLQPDADSLARKIFFQQLQEEIRELLSLLPPLATREAYLAPLPVLDVLTELVKKHLAQQRETRNSREAKLREQVELAGYARLLTALEPMLAGVESTGGLDFVGVTIKNPALTGELRRLAEAQTGGRFELVTAPLEDGGLIGLIATEKAMAKRLRLALSAGDLPELTFPVAYAQLPFARKVQALAERRQALAEELAALEEQQRQFARHWLPIYRRTLEWLQDRLNLMEATTEVLETGMCFYLRGWMPAERVESLQAELETRFRGELVVKELEIRAEDLERVPVALRNPAYFHPFELLSRLLPLPRYTSYDPTTFLGIFFPLFFGLILADAGYALLLVILVLTLLRCCRQRPRVVDAAKILGVCAAWTLLFGGLFGEFFGDLGTRLFGLQPLLFHRGEALLPLLYFALAVGVGHILLGLLLGLITALRLGQRREALFKLCNLLFILALGALLAAAFAPRPGLPGGVLIASVVGITLVATLANGLLAPLELLKSVGNIISYARIMAIGLTSVLLAYVANRLGGLTGDLLAGVLVAGVLHAFNLVLGIFAPTVHSLRLHYVEFFSKFLESGGRKFEPLDKPRK